MPVDLKRIAIAPDAGPCWLEGPYLSRSPEQASFLAAPVFDAFTPLNAGRRGFVTTGKIFLSTNGDIPQRPSGRFIEP